MNKQKALKEEARNMDADNYSEAREAYYNACSGLSSLQDALAAEGPASPELFKIAKALKQVIADFDTATDELGNVL